MFRLSLSFFRFPTLLSLASFLCLSSMHAQGILRLTDEHTFDTVSVKPADPNEKGMMVNFNASGTDARNTPVSQIILLAYGLENVSEIEGLPTWVSTQRYDIRAKPDEVYSEELNKMTNTDRWKRVAQLNQRMLQDRFGLKTHIETRHRKLIRLTQVSSDPSKLHLPISTNSGPSYTTMMPGAITAHAMSIAGLCGVLSKLQELGQRVTDATGLTGKYDFELHWLPPDSDDAKLEAYPPLNRALEEELGLQLERVSGDSEVLIVDSIHRPNAN